MLNAVPGRKLPIPNFAYRCSCTCTYPVVNDRWGATDVATLSLHFILFSASLTASQNFNPVHSVILFSQRFPCRPLLLPPCTVPCKIVLASPDDLDTCPNHFNLRFDWFAHVSGKQPLRFLVFFIWVLILHLATAVQKVDRSILWINSTQFQFFRH